MATIEYSLSSKKDKTTGKQEILVRFFHGRFNQRGKTNLYGHSEDWDQDRQRFVIPKVRMMTEEKRKEIQELQNLNSELDAISRYLLDAFVAAGSGKVPLPNKWVADKLLDRTIEELDIQAAEETLSKKRSVICKRNSSTRSSISCPFRRYLSLGSGITMSLSVL